MAELLGQEVADNIARATQCGAFDVGKVIGTHVKPATMLRVGLRLARYGGRIDEAARASEWPRVAPPLERTGCR